MKASELLKKWKAASTPRWMIPKDIVDAGGAEGFMQTHAPMTCIAPTIPTEEVLACLARLEAAVEALARTIPPGVVIHAGDKTYTDAKSWIADILDGKEGT